MVKKRNDRLNLPFLPFISPNNYPLTFLILLTSFSKVSDG